MNPEQILFHEIASELPETREGKMFGALCIKAPNGKTGVMYWKDYMIFKLEGEDLKEVLSWDGAKIFEPAPGRPMGGWVQLSNRYNSQWKQLAEKAMAYVKKL